MTLSNVNAPNSIDTLQASAAKTTTGNGTALTGYAAAQHLVIQLEVTAASGTLPTLDVVVQDSIDGTNWFTIATFTQATGTTVAVQRVTGAFTDQLRASWTIAGTNPSFTFNVKTFADA